MSGESAPTPPNYTSLISGLQGVAQTDTSLGSQQGNWAQGAYGTNLDTTTGAINSDTGTANTQTGIENSIDNQYQTTYQPLENQFAQQAENYASPEMIDQQMGRAGATAAQTQDQARTNAQKNLEGYGIDPSSTRYAALDANMETQKGAAVAGAENQAEVNTVNTGLGLESTAIGQGEVMPSMAAGAGNVALQANSGAVNSGLATTSSGASTMGTQPGYMNMANGAYGAWGNTLNSEYSNQLAQFQANQTASSGIGALAGSMLGGGGSFMTGAAKLAPLFAAAKGGAVPDIDDGDNDDIKPFVDHHFFVLHGFDDQGKRLEHIHAAAGHFFKTGRHIGVFNSPEEAQDHLQRQAYGKTKHYADGGAVDASDGGQVSPQLSPSGGAVTDDVPAVTNQGAPMRVNVDEYIVPKDVTKWKGQEFFQKLIDQSRKARAEASAKPTLSIARPQRAHAAVA